MTSTAVTAPYIPSGATFGEALFPQIALPQDFVFNGSRSVAMILCLTFKFE